MGLDISRRSFLKAAVGLAAIAVVKPVKLIDLFDEVAPEAKQTGKYSVSMWVKPADPAAALSPDSYFEGSIALVKIYDRVLSAEEIKAIYQHDRKWFESFEANSLGVESPGWRHITKYTDKAQVDIGPSSDGATAGVTWTQLPSGLWAMDFDGKKDYLTI